MTTQPGTSAPGSPEISLLHDARTGDLQAFGQLVRLHQAEVFGAALQLTGQHSTAAELALDAFVHLHAAITRISSPAHLHRWLLRAVSQRAMERHWPQTDEPGPTAAAADPGPDFTARVMASVELRWSHRRADFAPARSGQKRHPRRRGLLIGAVAVIGIAAATAVWMSGKRQHPVTAAVEGPEAAATSSAKPVAKQATTNVAATATTLAPRPARQQDAYPQYTVIVLPLRSAALDPDAIAPAEAFHAALVAELRKAPGIELLVPGVTAPPETLRSADYLLTVTSLDARLLPSGSTAFRITDSRGGSLSAGASVSGRQWPVEIRIQPIGQSQQAGFTSTLQIGEDSASLPQLAARQMELLRVRMFPDLLVKQQLMARIRDAALPATERNTALNELVGMQRDRGAWLDSIDISVIVAGATAMPAEERARLWRNLRGAANPELVETLLESMRRDPDITVRFEALATLKADYDSDARVRAAIESVSREDPEQLMRMAARRAGHGDAEWRKYIITALRDTTLPNAEKLAPLLIAAQSATTPAESLSMQSIVNDTEIGSLLAGVIRDSWFDRTQTQTIGDAFDLLAGAGNPAAFELLVEIPPDGSRARMMAAASPPIAPANAPQISPTAMSWLQRNRNNPRARRILEDMAAGRADPQAGAMIEQMMQQRPPPPPRR